jgi:hypothetical protein
MERTWEHGRVVKSNHRRRQDRAKRADSAQREARRRAANVQHERLFRALYDPNTPTDVVAAAILERFAPGPVPSGLPGLLAEQRGPGDVEAMAETLRLLTQTGGGGPSMTALTFGAHAAGSRGDHRRSRELMDAAAAAAAAADDPDIELRLAKNLLELGRVADTLDLLGARVAETAGNDVAAAAHGGAWKQAKQRVEGPGLAGECPCGSAAAWADCCRPREQAWLTSFADRGPIDALRSAVVEFETRTPYGPAIEAHVRDWLREADTASREASDVETLGQIAQEHAWLVADPDPDGGPDRDEACVLTALAADPATPDWIAAAARTWRADVRHGLWQVADPVPNPGLACVDLLTGHELYLETAPELAQGIARWSVLVGAIVPLAGAWRFTSTFVAVSPADGDELCTLVRGMTDTFLDEVDRPAGRGKGRRTAAPMPREIPPHNVLVRLAEAVDPVWAQVAGWVLASGLPRLLARLHEKQLNRPPAAGQGLGAPGEGRERAWLDTPAPALRGWIPRAMAGSPDWPLLESLLRQFEYDADTSGRPSLSIAWLRDQLGMPADRFR